MAKIKYREFKEDKIKDYEEFCKLAGEIEFIKILSNLDINKTNPNGNTRKVIAKLWSTDDKRSPFYEKFREIKKSVTIEKFLKSQNSNAMVEFINKLISNNHITDIKPIETIADLSEIDAVKIIIKTNDAYDLLSPVIKWIDEETNVIQYNHKYYDFENNKIKEDIPSKPSPEVNATGLNLIFEEIKNPQPIKDNWTDEELEKHLNRE